MSNNGRGVIYTIGYEGISASRLIELLGEHGVGTLVDARYRPGSRKRGLSKTPLSAACEKAAIGYAHDRGLGTPPEMLRQVRETGIYDWNSYRAHLLEQTDSLDWASSLAAAEPICLLCYEADASQCHRRIVAEEIADRAKLRIEHIPVSP
jgi:uncharacterized protein (DUF488 family)